MKIRIRCLVARDGSWVAGGHGGADGPGDGSGNWLEDGLPDHVGEYEFHQVFVEADVPLPPEPVVVEGEVVQ